MENDEFFWRRLDESKDNARAFGPSVAFRVCAIDSWNLSIDEATFCRFRNNRRNSRRYRNKDRWSHKRNRSRHTRSLGSDSRRRSIRSLLWLGVVPAFRRSIRRNSCRHRNNHR